MAAPAPAPAEDERQAAARRAGGAGRDPARPLGRAPRSRRLEARSVVRGGLLPRPGPPLAARPLPANRLRAAVGDRRPGRARGGPPDAHARAATRRRARGRGAGAGASLRARSPLRRRQRGRRGSLAPGRAPAAAAPVRAVQARRRADPDQAAVLRAVDQLGARASARGDGARAGRRAGGAPGPRLPTRQSGDHDPRRRLGGRRPGHRGADRQATGHDRFDGRGHWVQQLGGRRVALCDRGSSLGGRSPPAAEHARDRLPGRPLPR